MAKNIGITFILFLTNRFMAKQKAPKDIKDLIRIEWPSLEEIRKDLFKEVRKNG